MLLPETEGNRCNELTYNNEEKESEYINEALNELDQEDPDLIEAIQRMIVKPVGPDMPYNLTNNDERRFWYIALLVVHFNHNLQTSSLSYKTFFLHSTNNPSVFSC